MTDFKMDLNYRIEGMKLKIGAMGSAGGPITPEQFETSKELGRSIAQHDCVLITGACPGYPLTVAQGAKEAGGLVVGVSPALSLREHLEKYKSPTAYHDVMVYTGSGLMGREIVNIRSCDIVVILGGRTGTLGEFAIAYDEGKLIGALTGTGGVADSVDQIVSICPKETGAVIIQERDPHLLVDKLLKKFIEQQQHKSIMLH